MMPRTPNAHQQAKSPPHDDIHISPPNQQQQPIANTSGLASGIGSGVFLHFDKKLADCVKQFPCLYDSKTVGYKDKKTASKIWEIVAKEVEVETGKTFLSVNKL